MTVGGGSSEIYKKDHYRSTSGRKDGRRVILILTASESKKEEFEATLGAKYGCNVVFMNPETQPILTKSATLSDNDAATTTASSSTKVSSPECIDAIKKIAADWNNPDAASPQFILREECKLRDLRTHKLVSDEEREKYLQDPQAAPKFLADESFLAVWALNWNKTDGKLIDVDSRWFTHSNEGFLDASRINAKKTDTFGWDHLFVIPRLSKSYDDMKHLGVGKIASRQLTLSSFIHKYLLYQRPKSLTHNKELHPKLAVEFTPEMSVARFLETNQYTSNPNLKKWRLDKFQTFVLNQGIFFKAASSRPMGNFFSPPLGGVPLTPKKDAVEETVFLFHDVGHQGVPDLIYEGQDLATIPKHEAKEIMNIYSIWRMMSEGCTLVLADAIYGNTLAETNPEYVKCLDTRIYPLFKAAINNASNGGKNTLIETLHNLLWANVSFALVGDISGWEALAGVGVADNDESSSNNNNNASSGAAAVTAYKNHFEKFFIGDHIWTKKNFEGMCENHVLYKTWHDDIVTADRFAKSDLPSVSEVIKSLKKERNVSEAMMRGPMNKELVKEVFEYLFDTRFRPVFSEDSKQEIVPLPEEERLSNGFRRYIIGQSYFYARFSVALPEMVQKGKNLIEKCSFGSGIVLDAKKREEIQNQFAQDVRYVWSMGFVPAVEAESYLQIHPIFEPCFIDYYQVPFKSVKDTIASLHP